MPGQPWVPWFLTSHPSVPLVHSCVCCGTVCLGPWPALVATRPPRPEPGDRPVGPVSESCAPSPGPRALGLGLGLSPPRLARGAGNWLLEPRPEAVGGLGFPGVPIEAGSVPGSGRMLRDAGCAGEGTKTFQARCVPAHSFSLHWALGPKAQVFARGGGAVRVGLPKLPSVPEMRPQTGPAMVVVSERCRRLVVALPALHPGPSALD